MNHKLYAAYGTPRNGEIIDALGSDSVIILDGRWSLATAHEYMTTKAPTHHCKWATHYQLRSGSFTTYTNRSAWRKIPWSMMNPMARDITEKELA